MNTDALKDSGISLTEAAARSAAARDALPSMAQAINRVSDAFDKLPRDTNLRMLAALQGKHVYAGTVPAAVVAQRRAKNRAARKQRRVNRLNNFRKGVR